MRVCLIHLPTLNIINLAISAHLVSLSHFRFSPSCIPHLESRSLHLPQDCGSEQDSATKLGYTQTSWDNVSGKEPQPSSASKSWSDLTDEERKGAEGLGCYTHDFWVYTKGRPTDKSWSEMTSCGRNFPIVCEPFFRHVTYLSPREVLSAVPLPCCCDPSRRVPDRWL